MMQIKTLFGVYFILWGLAIIFLVPDDVPQKLINYCIIGAYVCAIFWWFQQGHYPWSAYWVSALAITCVVTFLNLTTR